LCNPMGIWGEDKGGMDALGGKKKKDLQVKDLREEILSLIS